MDSSCPRSPAPDVSSRPEDWLFLGGGVALDLVNTLRDRAVAPRETLASDADVVMWLVDAGYPVEPTAAPARPALRAEAVALRSAVDALLAPGQKATAEQVQLINTWSRVAPVPQLDEDAPGRLTRPPMTPVEALGAVAAEAVAIVERGELEQIKICSHETCGLRYLDHSRAGRRRWCSMRRCGNRAKAARHAAATRSGRAL
ncbi:CGNR zinc finger domain-containing protein [Nesterenkonia halophila]|uniref:CGNR zinc finger domain-containing protein n=1 Tax=Nesterenkonia halophila TaxID=302044 RepID=UPI0012923F5F|nr:CGNR zinc finger domain-containing protein [Nesterenkonia halophila]